MEAESTAQPLLSVASQGATLTLPWLALFVALVIATLVLVASKPLRAFLLPRRLRPRLHALREELGLTAWPSPLIVLIGTLWVALIAATVWGLLMLIAGLPFAPPAPPAGEADGGFGGRRLTLLAITALTATLGALVAFPFTLQRTHHSSRQTRAAEEGLVTDRINAAVQGLGAQKEVNRLGRTLAYWQDGALHRVFEWQDQPAAVPEEFELDEKYTTEWRNVGLTEPNLEVRIGAILALERIARQNLDAHVQIMEILCAYIRENAPASLAEDIDISRPAEGAGCGAWHSYRDALRRRRFDTAGRSPRSDIQLAATVIGRRDAKQIGRENSLDSEGDWQGFRLDLRRTCLQRADLRGCDLRHAKLYEARMEEADLSSARMEGALLWRAQMEGADLTWAVLNGAGLSDARLVGANLSGAHLEGAVLDGAQMNGAVLYGASLKNATFSGAWLQGADLREARLEGADLGWAQLAGSNLSLTQTVAAAIRQADLAGVNLSWSGLTGTAEEPVLLQSVKLSAAALEGSALRFVELLPVYSGPAPDFRNTFGDATAFLPAGIEPPCQWADEPLSDAEFFARWRGWVEAAPASVTAPAWGWIAPKEWRDVTPIPPPPGCTWHE